MTMYSTNDWRNYSPNELYHHGILGQKWGRKNGPPYPLDADDHSASEKKAGWHKSLDGGSKRDRRKLAGAVKRSFYTGPLSTDDSSYIKGIEKLKKNSRIIEASKELKSSYKEMAKAESKLKKVEDDFGNNKELYKKYAKKTADEIVKRYEKEVGLLRDDAKPSKEEVNSRKAEIRDYYENVRGIDAARAIRNRYFNDNEKLSKIDSDFLDAEKKFREDSEKVAGELLKEYADVPIKYTYGSYNKINSRASSVTSAALRELARQNYKVDLTNQQKNNTSVNTWNSDVEKALNAKSRKESDRLMKQAEDKRASYTRENKQQLLKNAKEKNQYDASFLELTDDDWSDAKVLREYSKYLDDPNKYERSH